VEARVPTYVYRCQQCGATIERRQGFQDPPLTTCEICSGELRRVLQPVGIIFKGSGFYSTDYRNTASSSRDDGKSESKTDSSKNGDTKPSTASESKTSTESASSTATSSPSTSSDS
jgi:putative FmdB family regulatory protein